MKINFSNYHLNLINDAQRDVLLISVEDTGIGIKKVDQDKLFKLFGFLDVTKELNT